MPYFGIAVIKIRISFHLQYKYISRQTLFDSIEQVTCGGYIYGTHEIILIHNLYYSIEQIYFSTIISQNNQAIMLKYQYFHT